MTTSILNAGFPDSSSYYRKADETLGMTAKQFRHGGENLAVRYALADCELGRCLVAESERGICAILLGDDDATLISELQQMFPAADNAPADLMFQQHVREVIASLNQRDTPLTLPLDIRGTAFQQQVWQALRTIPCGETVSYQQLANAIGKPKAVRAVAIANLLIIGDGMSFFCRPLWDCFSCLGAIKLSKPGAVARAENVGVIIERGNNLKENN